MVFVFLLKHIRFLQVVEIEMDDVEEIDLDDDDDVDEQVSVYSKIQFSPCQYQISLQEREKV